MLRSLFSLFLVLNFVFIANTFAQDHKQTNQQTQNTEDHHQVHKKHIISASLNHTVIFSVVKNDENKINIILPSFGFNYTFALNHKWVIGLLSDIIIEDFAVKGNEAGLERSGTEVKNTDIIERGIPISAALMVIYKPTLI